MKTLATMAGGGGSWRKGQSQKWRTAGQLTLEQATVDRYSSNQERFLPYYGNKC